MCMGPNFFWETGLIDLTLVTSEVGTCFNERFFRHILMHVIFLFLLIDRYYKNLQKLENLKKNTGDIIGDLQCLEILFVD